MTAAPVTTAPVTTAPAGWPDVERLFGVRGEPSRCWCRFFALTGAEWNGSTPRNRKAQLMEKFDGGAPAPGILAFRDGEPVGCFVVAPGHRRSGVAAALLRAAIGHAFGHGAAVVEAYPVDPALRPKAGPADLYQGTLKLFLGTGFSVVSDAVPGRAVVRLAGHS